MLGDFRLAAVHKLYCAPGNAGIAQVAECVDIAAEDIAGQVAFAQREKIDFVVSAPRRRWSPAWPTASRRPASRRSARRRRPRSSKAPRASSRTLPRHDIPTAAYERFTDTDAGRSPTSAQQGAPIVVKADGLAAGKGVIVAETVAQAIDAVRDMLAGRFGAAGAAVVIEEFLDGEEASFFALSDGEHALPLVGAQDHKRVVDGDTGPNTGGMGAYSPAPVLDAGAASARWTRSSGRPSRA